MNLRICVSVDNPDIIINAVLITSYQKQCTKEMEKYISWISNDDLVKCVSLIDLVLYVIKGIVMDENTECCSEFKEIGSYR